MKAADIVNQLALLLPSFVDDFTDNVAITSLTSAAGTATAGTVTPHGLAVGSQVRVTGAQTPIALTSLTRAGVVGTLVTDADHDITTGAGFDVQLAGAVEPEFNGTFVLLSVPNRRTIKFQMADSGPTVATGAPLLLNGSNYLSSYNGLVTVTGVPDPSTFEYDVPVGLFSPAAGLPVARTLPRVSAAVSLERLEQAYTKKQPGQVWAFVVLGDSVVSKSRGEDTDASTNYQPASAMRTKLIQTIDVYFYFPASAQIAGRSSRDRAEELLSPLCQCLLLAKFDTMTEGGTAPLQLSGHGFQAYNTAYYVHRYAFEAVVELGEADTYRPTDDVAFRDITMTTASNLGTEVITSAIDLDDIPL